MIENRNKLRSEKSKALYIYTTVIIALLGLALILYASYTYLGYVKINNIQEPGTDDLINAFCLMFTEQSFQLPITSDVIKEVLIMQVKDLWGLYVGIVCIIFIIVTSQNPNDYKGIEEGSARWGNKYELKKFTDSTGIPCADNFYITVSNPKKKYYSTHNLNEIIIAGSGAGKTYREVKPDIMQMIGSYVVTDPKGEIYRDTAKLLKANGYKVRVLNLTDINCSNTYNPFAYINSEQDILSVADLFMKNTAGDAKDDFWTDSAQDLLVAIMIYLWKTENEIKSFGRIIRLVNSIDYDSNGCIDNLCELACCFNHHMIDYPDDATTITWKGMKGTPQDTQGGIAKSLSSRLRLWSVSDVDELTSEDEMDFDDIGVHKTAIFVIIPPARQTYKVVANIFFSQLFERLMYCANFKHNGRLPLLVSCEIDEFANIGRIPSFCETLAVVRSANIRICIVLQSLAQLKSTYKDDYEGIISNCSIFTFLGTTDQESNEYVSKKLGTTTVKINSRSYNRGNQGGGSDSESYKSRNLLNADEIPHALSKGNEEKGGNCIVFVDEFYPFFLPKFDTVQHPKYSEVGSSYPDGIPNNTNIETEFANVRKERKKKYEELKRKSTQLSAELATGKYDKLQEDEEDKNEELIAELFASSDGEMVTFNNAVIDPNIDLHSIETA